MFLLCFYYVFTAVCTYVQRPTRPASQHREQYTDAKLGMAALHENARGELHGGAIRHWWLSYLR
jgi:hypothetical protein